VAGYSGTPLWKKLGIKPGAQWAIVGAPKGFVIDDCPVRVCKTLSGEIDGCVLFCTSRKELDSRIDAAIGCIRRDGGIWVAWPKKSSSLKSTLDFSIVRPAGLDRGLVDNKVCAIDDDWSGLRFVVRVADRKDWPR
jgi:hypothetical protein